MNQEPCVSEMSQGTLVPVTDRLVGIRESAEQAVHTPNDDEERLEQMSHPKNQGDGTDDAPRKVEWTCLGLYGMAMERSCSLWRRREFWDHSVPPNTTRSTRLSLCGCDPTTSISSLRASYGNINESAQTDGLAQATIQEVLHRSRCFAHRSSRARGLIRGWIQTVCGGSPQKKSPKKPINRMCLGEESTDEPSHSQATAPQVKDRWELPR